MSNTQWETLSNQAIAAAGVVYFLALLVHLAEWASLRQPARERELVGAGGPAPAETVSATVTKAGVKGVSVRGRRARRGPPSSPPPPRRRGSGAPQAAVGAGLPDRADLGRNWRGCGADDRRRPHSRRAVQRRRPAVATADARGDRNQQLPCELLGCAPGGARNCHRHRRLDGRPVGARLDRARGRRELGPGRAQQRRRGTDAGRSELLGQPVVDNTVYAQVVRFREPILVGQNARIDVGGLVASTLGISNDDFLGGRFKFDSANALS